METEPIIPVQAPGNAALIATAPCPGAGGEGKVEPIPITKPALTTSVNIRFLGDPGHKWAEVHVRRGRWIDKARTEETVYISDLLGMIEDRAAEAGMAWAPQEPVVRDEPSSHWLHPAVAWLVFVAVVALAAIWFVIR